MHFAETERSNDVPLIDSSDFRRPQVTLSLERLSVAASTSAHYFARGGKGARMGRKEGKGTGRRGIVAAFGECSNRPCMSHCQTDERGGGRRNKKKQKKDECSRTNFMQKNRREGGETVIMMPPS